MLQTSPRAALAQPAPLSPDEKTGHWVAFCVARDFAVEASELIGPARGKPRLAFARQVAMYICHVGFSLSFACIGRVFGRDRSTIAHACRVIEDERDDRWLDCRIAALELVCRSALEAVHHPESVLGEDAR